VAAPSTQIGQFFTAATYPNVVINTILGLTLLPNGVINLPLGTYRISANVSAGNTTDNVSYQGAAAVICSATVIPYSSANWGEIYTVENQASGWNQTYQNISPWIHNTLLNGQNLYFQGSFAYAGGVTLCFANLTIVQLNL